jgi:hypothetical protein
MRKIVYGAVGAVIVIVALVYAGLWMEQGGVKEEGDYTRNSYHIYTVAPGVETHGSSYTIPPSLAEGTNLSADTYLSYEETDATKCDPSAFLDGVTEVREVTDDGVVYIVAERVGAAAGNRYDETVYVFKDYKPCNAVRYFIHYGVLENYPEGMVREFDRAALVAQFDDIRRGLAKSR